MLPSSKNILENVLNSKFSFKLTANCKALILLGNDLVCAGLENGEICIFSATKFQFVSNYQALDGPIIHIEHLDLKEDFLNTNEEEKAGSERRSRFVVMIQGKEGDIAFIRYVQDSKSFETILKWKESTVVGFTKVTVNNQVWQTKIDSPTPSFLLAPKIFERLDQVRLFYPDNDSQNLESYRLQTDTLKKEELFIPPAKGAKEINICCLKYLSFEEYSLKSEFVLSAEENSRIGMISLSPTKFSSSKFKEICQMEKKGYAYCIEPYQLVKEDENLTLKLLIGLNIEEALMISINMTTLKVASTNMIALSPSLKPGLNNAIAFRDGKYILVSTSDFKIKICRTKDFKPVVSLSVHENFINDILIANISEDKEYLFSCSENYDFCILDLSSLKKAQ